MSDQALDAEILRHALRDGFFHADMHQGNLRVAEDGTLVMLDFGIMGRLDPITRRHYAEILHGFLTRDYTRVAEVHFEAGYVPPDRSVEEFSRALRSIGEPIFGQDASEISMARVLAYLLETTEPALVKRAIALVAGACALLMLTGWRFKNNPGFLLTLFVGLAGGSIVGATFIALPLMLTVT